MSDALGEFMYELASKAGTVIELLRNIETDESSDPAVQGAIALVTSIGFLADQASRAYGGMLFVGDGDAWLGEPSLSALVESAKRASGGAA